MSFKKGFSSISGGKDLKEIIHEASVTFILRVVGLITSYVFNIIFARIYGADVIGIFGLVLSVHGIFSLLANAGSQTSVVRFIAQYGNNKDYGEVSNIYAKYLKALIPLSLLFTLLFYLYSPFFAETIFRNELLIIPFRIIAFTVPLSVFFTINIAALRGLKEIGKAFVFQALTPVFNLIGMIFITYTIVRHDLVPITAQAISTFLVALISYILWKRVMARKTNKSTIKVEYKTSYKNILNVSLPMMITAGMFYILGWTDTLMLGIFRTEAEVGIYRIALKVALFTSFTLSAVNSIAGPKFSELYWSGDKRRLKATIQNSAQLIFFTSLPIFFMLVFFSKEILWLFGERFIEGRVVLIILSIGQFINAAFGSVGLLLDMTGNQKIFRNAVILGAVLNIILNALLIPKFGISGAAIATAASTIVWNLKTAISVYKIFGYWVGYKPTLKIIS